MFYYSKIVVLVIFVVLEVFAHNEVDFEVSEFLIKNFIGSRFKILWNWQCFCSKYGSRLSSFYSSRDVLYPVRTRSIRINGPTGRPLIVWRSSAVIPKNRNHTTKSMLPWTSFDDVIYFFVFVINLILLTLTSTFLCDFKHRNKNI